MLKWIADNKELLIALFGAGGAGAVLMTAIVKKGGDARAASAPPSVNVTATSDGIAVGHAGKGNVDVQANRAVGAKAINDLEQLGLTLTETALLFRALETAGMGPSEQDSATRLIFANAETKEALMSALRCEDIPRAAAIVARAAVVRPPSLPAVAAQKRR